MRPGASRRKPAGRYPEVLPRMAARPVPPGRGPRSPVYTSVRTLTNRARPVRRTSLRRDPGPGTRHTAVCTFGLRTFRTSCRRGPSPMDVSSIATAYTAFSEVLVGFCVGHGEPFRATEYVGASGAGPPGAVGLPVGRGMTTARRSPASHALHCLRLPGRPTIRLFGAASGARRSGSQSAQSWPISAHLRRDCERPIMVMNRWLPVTAHGGGTLPCPQMLILPGLHAESAEIIRHCR